MYGGQPVGYEMYLPPYGFYTTMTRTRPGISVISLLLLQFVIGSQAVSLLDTDSQAHTQLGDTADVSGCKAASDTTMNATTGHRGCSGPGLSPSLVRI